MNQSGSAPMQVVELRSNYARQYNLDTNKTFLSNKKKQVPLLPLDQLPTQQETERESAQHIKDFTNVEFSQKKQFPLPLPSPKQENVKQIYYNKYSD